MSRISSYQAVSMSPLQMVGQQAVKLGRDGHQKEQRSVSAVVLCCARAKTNKPLPAMLGTVSFEHTIDAHNEASAMEALEQPEVTSALENYKYMAENALAMRILAGITDPFHHQSTVSQNVLAGYTFNAPLPDDAMTLMQDPTMADWHTILSHMPKYRGLEGHDFTFISPYAGHYVDGNVANDNGSQGLNFNGGLVLYSPEVSRDRELLRMADQQMGEFAGDAYAIDETRSCPIWFGQSCKITSELGL